jgi:hypothetical protein
MEVDMAKKRSPEVKPKSLNASTLSQPFPSSVMWHQPGPEELRQRVEQKAYELFERRGRDPGHDLEDWLEAERLVKQELVQPRSTSYSN